MNILKFINNNSFFLTIIFFAIFLLISFVFYSFIHFFKKRKIDKTFFKLISKSANEEISIKSQGDYYEFSIETKFFSFKKVKNGDDLFVSWYAISQILTTVIANEFDNEYGNCKEALDSIYKVYNKLRDIVSNSPAAYKANTVILYMSKMAIRPFLTKWNNLINEKKKFSKKEFIKDYSEFRKKIIDSKEGFLFLLSKAGGIKMKFRTFYISDDKKV